VTNTGTLDGDDVVLAYILPPQVLCDGQTPPIKQLFGFQRVNLNVDETKQVFYYMVVQFYGKHFDEEKSKLHRHIMFLLC
jgi:hypothetical protein